MREIRATLAKCLENGTRTSSRLPGARRPTRSSKTCRRCTPAPSAWAAATCSPRALSPRWRTCSRTGARRSFFYLSIDFLREQALTPKQAMHQQALEALSARARAGPARQREPQPDAPGQHHRALPLHRRLGCDHHGQEPGHDPVRAARLPHQGQPQVRLGEERPADDLLPVGGTGADPRQLRVLLRRRGAVAGPERVPAHERPRRPEGRRRLHHPERAGDARGSLGVDSRTLPAPDRGKEDPVFYLDAFRIARDEATDVELQLRMQGIAFQGAFFRASPVAENAGLSEVAAGSHPRAAAAQVRCQGRARRRRQHARGASAATTNWSRSRVSAPGNRRSRYRTCNRSRRCRRC
jgi:pyruvate-ferredoxin/flavodoxin oxidoreductase